MKSRSSSGSGTAAEDALPPGRSLLGSPTPASGSSDGRCGPWKYEPRDGGSREGGDAPAQRSCQSADRTSLCASTSRSTTTMPPKNSPARTNSQGPIASDIAGSPKATTIDATTERAPPMQANTFEFIDVLRIPVWRTGCRDFEADRQRSCSFVHGSAFTWPRVKPSCRTNCSMISSGRWRFSSTGSPGASCADTSTRSSR